MKDQPLLCKLNLHDYDYCTCRRCRAKRSVPHLWDGCRCKVCGQYRGEGHRWDGCRCAVCGRTRDEGHRWDGCRCSVCGRTRDEGHDWDGCVCRKCGRTRWGFHDWDGCVCRKCGAKRITQGHIFDAETVRKELNPAHGGKILSPFSDRKLKCARCGMDVSFRGGHDYCPVCFGEIGTTTEYTDSPTVMKRVIHCRTCGYRAEYTFSDGC